MTEFDREVKSRKALVPSARRKKNGVKSKRCTMPFEYMTKKEIAKMNGELTSINLNKPYSMPEFKQFPETMQAEYLQNLVDKFDMSTVMPSKLLGCSISYANRIMRNLGIRIRANGKKSTKAQREAFDNFIKQGVNDEVEDASDEVEVKVEAEPAPVVKRGFVSPLSATLTHSGSVREVCEALVYALGAGSAGEFEITFKREVEPEC